MKCDGNGEPPCSRCSRVKALCIFEPPWRPSGHASTSVPPSSVYGIFGHTDASFGPPANAVAGFHKRRKLNMDTLQQAALPTADSRTPYSTVLDLDDPLGKSRTPRGNEFAESFTESHACLIRAGLNSEEAAEMFLLFGQRIAPFIPTLLDVDFHTLSTSPIFNLAAVYTIARYLPETETLRMQCGQTLRELLGNLLFESFNKKSRRFLIDTLHGLAILYSYCEASDRDVETGSMLWRFDMLSLKSIIEGFAIKIGVAGMGSAQAAEDPTLCLYWIWMYTISH